MQEVVELPRLVPDPQVVGLLLDEVVEHHEVRDQDLVHPPQRLKAAQVVLGRLGLDVSGLARQVRAGGMDPLPAGLEHRRDRMLREPIDPKIRMQLAQFIRDRHVALRVTETDGR